MKDPRASVVIPAFNAGQWIEQSLAGVASQTFQDWEIIVVDDGSSDDTANRVTCSEIPGIRLISQSNQGPTAARNRGFSEARGEYVALLDADDQYEPRFLECTIRCLEENPSFGFVATNEYRADRSGSRKVHFRSSPALPETANPSAVNYCRARLEERSFPSNTAMVLRRSLIERLGGYDPTIVVGEELELVLRWACRTRLGYISEPLVTYFDRPKSFNKDLDRSIRERVHLWDVVLADDQKYLDSLIGYSLLRNFCLFRLAAVAVASGHFNELEQIGRLWPLSPKDRYWWVGRLLTSMPRVMKELVHFVLGRTKYVRHRNDPAAMMSANDDNS